MEDAGAEGDVGAAGIGLAAVQAGDVVAAAEAATALLECVVGFGEVGERGEGHEALFVGGRC